MGNTISILGGGEVPVSFKYPWGINVDMNIPLKFANDMRTEGSVLNKEYKRFIAHRVYELIPGFINVSQQFKDKYPKFIMDLMNINNKVGVIKNNQIKVARIQFIGHFKMLLEWCYQLKHNDNKPLCLSKIIHFSAISEIPILYLYPFYLNDIIDELIPYFQRINFYDENTVFTDNEYIMSIMQFSDSIDLYIDIDTSSDIPSVNWDKYFTLRKEKSLQFIEKHGIYKFNPYILDLNKRLDLNEIEDNRLAKLNNDTIFNNLQGLNIISISVKYFERTSHAISVIIDMDRKQIYIADSDGISLDDLNLIKFLKKNGRFDNFIIIPIMPQTNGPGFQSITKDEFCQTWTIYISTLIILNHINPHVYTETTDLNMEVFNEILQYAKPLVGYEANMTKGVKLGLLLIEFMFYIYKYFDEEFKQFCRDFIIDNRFNAEMQEMKISILRSIVKKDRTFDLGIFKDSIYDGKTIDEIYNLAVDDFDHFVSNITQIIGQKYDVGDIHIKEFTSYEYSDDLKMFIKKITKNVKVDQYSSSQLISAILSGKI